LLKTWVLKRLTQNNITKTINLKTKALYISCYDFEDSKHVQLAHLYLKASDIELEKYFRTVVYKAEYGEALDQDARVDVYELSNGYDYETRQLRKIKITA
jgi:hypothetical protein